MKLDNILQFFLPKNDKFYPLFEEASQNLVDVSNKLVQMLYTANRVDRTRIIKEIEDLEHIGDGLSHKINYELNLITLR